MSDFYVDDLDHVVTHFELIVFLLCTNVAPSDLTHTFNAENLADDVVATDEMFRDVHSFEDVLSINSQDKCLHLRDKVSFA